LERGLEMILTSEKVILVLVLATLAISESASPSKFRK
jgi:hypothetical protein